MGRLDRADATGRLPALVSAAASRLAAATSSAEVLDARDMADAAYHAAKTAGRMLRAKGAHDELLIAAYRAQADALEIEALAKIRLADEYDAAQERGEVATVGQPKSIVPNENNTSTAADIGLTSKEVYEARQIRDAALIEPGVIQEVIRSALQDGDAPTKARLKREINARRPFVTANTGKIEWHTPPHLLDRARAVLGGIDFDPASSAIANANVQAARYFTAEDDALSQEWPIGRIWMNPPYSQALMKPFCERFALEMERGSAGIVLVNNATETGWFNKLMGCASAVCFLRGRVRYLNDLGEQEGAPLQGQAILYSGPDSSAFREQFGDSGFIVGPLT